MQVFVDSNQFIADFLLKGAPLRYLLHFISNSGGTLLLSRLVVEEVENKYSEEARAAVSDWKRSQKRLLQLGFDSPDTVSAPGTPRLDLKQSIREYTEDIEIFEYASVPHAHVVARALRRRKPFDADGRNGYRDCLLWMSLLQHLQSQGRRVGEVAFISNNSTDFYSTALPTSGKSGATKKDKRRAADSADAEEPDQGELSPASKKPVEFHSDLKEELERLGLVMLPFESVASFVETRVDKHRHAINYDKKWVLFEEFIEERGLGVLQTLAENPANAAVVLKEVFAPATASALTILDSNAETLEGVEDFDIYVAEDVKDEVYIGCGYDLRIVNVTLFVPRGQFENHRSEIEAASHVWEVTPLDELVAVRLSLRAYYQASFQYDPKTAKCDGYSLNLFDVR